MGEAYTIEAPEALCDTVERLWSHLRSTVNQEKMDMDWAIQRRPGVLYSYRFRYDATVS